VLDRLLERHGLRPLPAAEVHLDHSLAGVDRRADGRNLRPARRLVYPTRPRVTVRRQTKEDIVRDGAAECPRSLPAASVNIRGERADLLASWTSSGASVFSNVRVVGCPFPMFLQR
jgi:hypothetical protein